MSAYRSVKGYSAATQLAIMFLFVGAGLVLSTVVTYFIFLPLVPSGTAADSMQTGLTAAMKNPQNVNYLRLSQVLGSFLIMCVPALLWNYVVNGRSLFWLGFNKYFSLKEILVGIALLVCGAVIAVFLADVSKWILNYLPKLHATALTMENMYKDQLQAMSNLATMQDFIISLVVIAFFPALFEEMFFRGMIQTFLNNWLSNGLAALLLSSFLFSAIHFSITLFLSRFFLGFVLGLIFMYTKNIWVPVLAHFFNNAYGITQMYMLSKEGKLANLDSVDESLAWYWYVLAAALLYVGFVYLNNISKANRYKIFVEKNTLQQEQQVTDS